MAGSGETYFSAFALFLKANTAQIGFLASVPPLLASFAQLFSAWLGHKTGKRKAIILTGAILQGMVWIPMAILPLVFREHSIEILIACVVLFYSFGNLAAPQWSSLMGELVAERKRGRYFALRTRVCSITSFVALILAGVVLHFFNAWDYTKVGYLLIFTIAFAARFVSVYHIAQMYDPPGHVAAMEVPISMRWWHQIRYSQMGRFSLFFAMIQFSVAVGSPFFSVYLLRDLHFSYLEYMSCTASTVLMQFLTLNRWGRISDIFGNRVILMLCGTLIPSIPLLWTLSGNFYYLLAVQALGGFAWAGFTLSASNYLYDLIPAGKRATYLAVNSVVASTGVFLGAMLGGVIGANLPGEFSLFGIQLHLLSALYPIFFLSFLLRLTTVWLFLPKIREARKVKPITMRRLIFRVARFSAVSGLIFDVMGSRRKSLTPPSLEKDLNPG